jgi:hypothetical protein
LADKKKKALNTPREAEPAAGAAIEAVGEAGGMAEIPIAKLMEIPLLKQKRIDKLIELGQSKGVLTERRSARCSTASSLSPRK